MVINYIIIMFSIKLITAIVLINFRAFDHYYLLRVKHARFQTYGTNSEINRLTFIFKSVTTKAQSSICDVGLSRNEIATGFTA